MGESSRCCVPSIQVRCDCSITQAESECVLEALMAELSNSPSPDCLVVAESALDFNNDGSFNLPDYFVLLQHVN